jgi:hypothetical protein
VGKHGHNKHHSSGTPEITLELEKDLPSSVQRALDSTEFSSVALQVPCIDDIVTGVPKGIPDVPDKPKRKTGDGSIDKLKQLLIRDVEAQDGPKGVVGGCEMGIWASR